MSSSASRNRVHFVEDVALPEAEAPPKFSLAWLLEHRDAVATLHVRDIRRFLVMLRARSVPEVGVYTDPLRRMQAQQCTAALHAELERRENIA
jgi:hypothetical protein